MPYIAYTTVCQHLSSVSTYTPKSIYMRELSLLLYILMYRKYSVYARWAMCVIGSVAPLVFGCRFFPHSRSPALCVAVLVFALNTVYLLECECCLSIVDKVHYSYLVTHIRYSPVVFDYICAFFSFFLSLLPRCVCSCCFVFSVERDVSVLFSTENPNSNPFACVFAVRTHHFSLNTHLRFHSRWNGPCSAKCDPVSDWTLTQKYIYIYI